MTKKNKINDDFYERKYRIYSDFLNNFDNDISFKGLEYRDYFIKHFEYEFIYSLKLFCLTESHCFSIGAKASFIRRAIESYVYISFAKNKLLYIENYKLFKFKLKKDMNLIGQKEKDQILNKFYLKNVLTLADYKRLLRIAKRENMIQDYMIIQTLAKTGIRISELKYFTVDNLKKSNKKINRANLNKQIYKFICKI